MVTAKETVGWLQNSLSRHITVLQIKALHNNTCHGQSITSHAGMAPRQKALQQHKLSMSWQARARSSRGLQLSPHDGHGP